MASMAKDKLKPTICNGEQQCWDFEKYINVQKSQHLIMEGLVQLGFTGIDPRSKVSYILDGIMTETILMCSSLCIKILLAKQASKYKTPSKADISEVRTSARGTKRKSENIEVRYHAKAECDALSADDKRELAAKRLKRGHKPGAKDI
jgi:hypothetical protein